MKQRTADDLHDRLKAAYEAGRKAVRHFDSAELPQAPKPERPQEQPGWHH